MDPASFISGIGVGIAMAIAYYEFYRRGQKGPDKSD